MSIYLVVVPFLNSFLCPLPLPAAIIIVHFVFKILSVEYNYNKRNVTSRCRRRETRQSPHSSYVVPDNGTRVLIRKCGASSGVETPCRGHRGWSQLYR